MNENEEGLHTKSNSESLRGLEGNDKLMYICKISLTYIYVSLYFVNDIFNNIHKEI